MAGSTRDLSDDELGFRRLKLERELLSIDMEIQERGFNYSRWLKRTAKQGAERIRRVNQVFAG